MAPDATDALAEAAVLLRRPARPSRRSRSRRVARRAQGASRDHAVRGRACARGAAGEAPRAAVGAVNAALDEGHAIAEADYRAALAARDTAIAYFADWLARYDAVLSPPATGGAPRGLASTGDPGCCTLVVTRRLSAIALPSGFDCTGPSAGRAADGPAEGRRCIARRRGVVRAQLSFGARVAPVSGAA
jgi:hypothetical protein